MGVADGQPVSAAVTNPAFIDANADDTGFGVYQLANALSASGPFPTNIQREHNSIASFVGKALNSVYNDLPTWTSSNRGTSGDNILQRVEAIDAAFDPATGHMHTGAAGDAPPIPLGTGVIGVLPEVNGGTNQSTYATGDLLYASAANTLSKLPIGTAGQSLTVTGGIPVWGTGGGGGSGSSLDLLLATPAPTEMTSDGWRLLSFDPGDIEQVTFIMKVPDSITLATDMFIDFVFATPTISLNTYFECSIGLIRPGTTDYPNFTDFNLANFTIAGVGTANLYQLIDTFQVMTGGTIGATALQPGDYLQVYFYRKGTSGSDTNTTGVGLVLKNSITPRFA